MSDKRVDFSEMLSILVRRWRLPATLCSITAVLALLLNFLILPKWYESTTVLMPPQEKSGFGIMGMLMSRVSDMPGGLSRLASGVAGINSSQFLFVVILNSQTVADSLIDKYDLMKVYKSKYRFQARKELANHTWIDFPPEGHIVVKVEAKGDPVLAQNLAREYTTQLNNVILDRGIFAAAKRRRFLDRRLEDEQNYLKSLEDSLVVMQKKYGIIAPEEQAKGLAEIVTAPLRGTMEYLALLEAEREGRQVELEIKKDFYTTAHPEVKRLMSEIREMDVSIRKLRGEINSATTIEPGKFTVPLADIPDAAMEYMRLYRSVKIHEEMYALLAAQLEEARLNEADDVPSAIILDPANLPEYKSRPRRLLNVAISAGVALVLSLLYIMAAARFSFLKEE